MKILYLHQYFNTPSEPGGTRSYWIAQELVKRGHEVIMITGTNNALHKEASEEIIDGVHVIYLKNAYSNYMGALARIRSFVNFMFKAIRAGMKQKDISLVFATSTPLTIGAIAIWLKWAKGWRYVFEVRDLWPEGLIQEGITNPIVVWALRLLERWSYEKAEHVVSLSPGMEEGVLKIGIPKEKSTMVPNMSKPDKFYPREPNPEIIRQFGINMSKFNLIHFGAMGFDNYVEYIINAARLAQEQGYDDLNFILLGDGSTVPAIKSLVEEYKLSNVQYLGNHKMDVVSEIVNCCDASIVSFQNIPILATNSPNKLFDSLSAGKPIIVNSAGWTKDMVEQENCGFYVHADYPQQLVDKLNEVKNNKELLELWGAKSRELSLTRFDKKILSAKVADLLEGTAENIKKRK